MLLQDLALRKWFRLFNSEPIHSHQPKIVTPIKIYLLQSLFERSNLLTQIDFFLSFLLI